MFNYVTTRRYPDGAAGRLKEPEARWYFQQLILAVDYLHKMVRVVRCQDVNTSSMQGVASRDIKLENCLLVPSPRNPPEFQGRALLGGSSTLSYAHSAQALRFWHSQGTLVLCSLRLAYLHRTWQPPWPTR